MSLIEKEPWALETSVFGTFLHVSVPEEQSAKIQIDALLKKNGISYNKIERRSPSLEDVFIYLLDQEAKKVA